MCSQVVMLVQTDVTARMELENKLADLTDAQLSMLEQLFPRHIIEYMLARVPNKGDRNLRDLANMHEQVCVRGMGGHAEHARVLEKPTSLSHMQFFTYSMPACAYSCY